MKNYMAIDQYGQTFHSLGPHPRKALMKQLDCKHVAKMYNSDKDGDYHAGWIIGGRWLTVCEVIPMKNRG